LSRRRRWTNPPPAQVPPPEPTAGKKARVDDVDEEDEDDDEEDDDEDAAGKKRGKAASKKPEKQQGTKAPQATRKTDGPSKGVSGTAVTCEDRVAVMQDKLISEMKKALGVKYGDSTDMQNWLQQKHHDLGLPAMQRIPRKRAAEAPEPYTYYQDAIVAWMVANETQ
jgi:hypothetical protein